MAAAGGRSYFFLSAVGSLVLLGTVGMTADAVASPGRPKIIYPRGEHPVCGGYTDLLGTARDQSSRARWSYSTGERFHRIHGRTLPLEATGSPVLRTGWNTRGLAQGKTRLQLRIGRHSRVARSSFTLDRNPVVGPIRASANPETGLVTLRAPQAHDPGHPSRRPALRWFLGDGTKERGPTVNHIYEPGEYIIDVQAEDEDGCKGTTVVDLTVPINNDNEKVPEVDWCDPLKISVKHEGKSDDMWPPDVGANPEAKDPPEKVELGRRQGHGYAVAFGFETTVQVLGNPKKCRTHQVIRTRHLWDDKKEGMQGYFNPLNTLDYDFADDGYTEDYRFRKSVPGPQADGTAEIRWVDFPGVKAGKNITNAQVKATFIDLVTGQEAPITHTENESDDGESAWMQFSVCAAWDPPAGQKDSDFEEKEKKEPDAAFPKPVLKKNLAPADDFFLGAAPASKIKGCGKK